MSARARHKPWFAEPVHVRYGKACAEFAARRGPIPGFDIEPCAVCGDAFRVRESERLCPRCEVDRLTAASAARILAGSGLTYSNAEAYSEERYIEAHRTTPATPKEPERP